MKKGIIFDMDGTMFDTESVYQKGWELMAHRFRQVYNPEFQIAACGTSGVEMINTVRRYYPEVDPEQFIRECTEWMEEQIKVELPEKPGLREILACVKEQGYILAIASGSKKEIIRHNLKKSGLEDYFSAITSGYEVEKGKPAPDVFLLAAKRLGLKPEECFVIEDGCNGVKAALAAGCATIMVPDLVAPDEELKSRCVGVYETLLDVKEAFEQGIL